MTDLLDAPPVGATTAAASTGAPGAVSSEGTPRHMTTSQALATYDAERRAEATLVGKPIDRTATVGMHLPDDLGDRLAAVVYLDPDGWLKVLDMREDSAPMAMTPDLLASLMGEAYEPHDPHDPEVENHAPFVFADAEALRRTVKFATRLAKERGTIEARGAARMLDYRANLPFSVYSPVLTEALASRYWLPATLDPADVSAWDAAFEHGRRTSTREAFSHLIARAADGHADTSLMKSLAGAEKHGARAAKYGSSHSQCSAFTRAGTVTDAHAAVLSLDPLLRMRNTLLGVITEIRIEDVGEETTATIVGEPGKLREGARVTVFTGTDYAAKVDVMLHRLDFVDDRLVAALGAPSAKDRNANLLGRAAAEDRSLFMTPAAFLMVRKSPKNRRWTEGSEVRNVPLDIPADIALAGAPAFSGPDSGA